MPYRSVGTLKWTGKLFIGAKEEPMNVLFDTASDWLMLQGKDCRNCEGNPFDIKSSSSARIEATPNSERVLGASGDLVVTGSDYADTVCIFPNKCVDFFKLFMIESAEASLG